MKRLFRVLSFVYFVFACLLFYAQNNCYCSLRVQDGPSLNFYLIGIGFLLQLLHVSIFLYCALRGVPGFVKDNSKARDVLVVFVIFSFFGYGMVRHGMLQGDQGRAYFSVDNPCSDWSYVFLKLYQDQ